MTGNLVFLAVDKGIEDLVLMVQSTLGICLIDLGRYLTSVCKRDHRLNVYVAQLHNVEIEIIIFMSRDILHSGVDCNYLPKLCDYCVGESYRIAECRDNTAVLFVSRFFRGVYSRHALFAEYKDDEDERRVQQGHYQTYGSGGFLGVCAYSGIDRHKEYSQNDIKP